MRGLFTELAEHAGAADSPELGRQLQIIYDEDTTAPWMDRDPSIASSSRVAVESLLGAAL
jgi:hypothetical protein